MSSGDAVSCVKISNEAERDRSLLFDDQKIFRDLKNSAFNGDRVPDAFSQLPGAEKKLSRKLTGKLSLYE